MEQGKTTKDTAPEPKRVVFPLEATRRFEEIFRKGGVITSITVNYGFPSKPGFVNYGQSFLSGKEIKGIEIK